ncbi:hypothetical protein Ddye_024008 [Dipteronia dyeriana]|uniref:Uncharacterized protein n=1 Tax=Dipteronia dyeriana TaxID=168575 RepID=A0AAD9TTZ2_9ROSI|nr:hypothetical protein Ddye_024008 [Dipteronia dyeriana]
MSVLSNPQLEEMGRGLLGTGRPFLGVIREKEEAEELSCIKELEEQGKIVRWCLELVMGSKEMASNAKKWMELAREAAKDAGDSSHKNLKDYVDQVSHV